MEFYGVGLRVLATFGGVESFFVFRSYEVVEITFLAFVAVFGNVYVVKKISITERSGSVGEF